MFFEDYGDTKKGDQSSIPIDLVQDYGVWRGTGESLKDLVTAVSFILPMTWTVYKGKNGNEKVLFFRESKVKMMDDDIEPKPKNADIKVSKGEAWVIFHGLQEDENGDEVFACGFATVDKEVIVDLIMKDIADDNAKVMAIGVDKDGDIKEMLDEGSIDPKFLRYAVESYVNQL